MIFKRIIIVVAIISLFGLTGAKVGALWPQQRADFVGSPSSQLLLVNNVAGGTSSRLNPQDEIVLDRLNLRLQHNPDDYEASLLKGLLLFQGGDLAAAITELQALTAKAPKFQLAHLILGDLLLARFDQVDTFGLNAVSGGKNSAQSKNIEQLQKEARARLHGYLASTDGVKIPRALITLSDQVDYALVVDKEKNRLYIYRNVGSGLPPELVDDFYIVLGKREGDKYREGDLKTPVGVYFVTSFLPDEKLPPLYGSGAFPVNYPNEYDRNLRKTGSGIWLHGTDKSLYSRPPLDSEGCVVLTNHEFSRIGQYVKVGRTPVIINATVDWISSGEWLELNIEIQAALETWRRSWEQADLTAYLDNYADIFWSKKHNKTSWGDSKRRVFAGKSFQKIALSNISVLSYPTQKDNQPVIVANFVQHYQSNNFNGDMHKRLYLVKQQGDWKVLYEGRQ